MIQFILLVNKQGQTRVAQYYQYKPLEERVGLETEIVRRCLAVPENSVGPFYHYYFSVSLSSVRFLITAA